ncbi:MAG: hypothetical protein KF812_00120 [Fimbriimonadaceae bacterium]|nr:hypothetical protein [Fimbriimonadaceae bacterium]
MKPLTLDKVASVTYNCNLDREVRVGNEFPCQSGDVVAVRVKNSKSTYNVLELPTGRFSSLKPGDIIAGALGHRRALQGYAGVVPDSLAVGDTVQLLNMGGVLGHCTSASAEVGPPFECEVLGQVLEFPFLGSRTGIPANIARQVGPLDETLSPNLPPVLAIVGTCMNSGKTQACANLIQEFTREHRRVAACKVTGVSLRRDVLGMADAGAHPVTSFTDLGVVTSSRETAPAVTRTLLNRLAKDRPDLIVVELGDGLMGDYGVDAIFQCADLRDAFTSVVLAANDPVGAWGGTELLRNTFEAQIAAITGPCTDNEAGSGAVTRTTGCLALNARSQARELAAQLLASLGVVG